MGGSAFPEQRQGLFSYCVVRDKHKSRVLPALPVCVSFSFQQFLGLFLNLEVSSSSLNLSVWKSEFWNKATCVAVEGFRSSSSANWIFYRTGY